MCQLFPLLIYLRICTFFILKKINYETRRKKTVCATQMAAYVIRIYFYSSSVSATFLYVYIFMFAGVIWYCCCHSAMYAYVCVSVYAFFLLLQPVQPLKYYVYYFARFVNVNETNMTRKKMSRKSLNTYTYRMKL